MSFPTRLRLKQRRRRDGDSTVQVVTAGLLAFAAFALFVYIAVNASNGVPLRDYRTVYATVPQVGNLIRHDPVRVAGVRVGQVLDAQALPEGGARIKLQLEPGTRLPADTDVAVRGNGLLGARYVQLIPGSSSADLPAGRTIRGGHDAYSFGVPETLDTFDAETRGALGTVVRELGTGVVGRGDAINWALATAGPEMPRVPLVVESVLRRDGAARRLLPSLHGATRALDAVGRPLADLLDPASRVLAPFVVERNHVRDALEIAPDSLAAAERGLATGRRLLSATGDLSESLRRTLPPAPAALRRTAALLHDSHGPLARSVPVLHDARTSVPSVLKITRALSPVLPRLDGALEPLGPIIKRIAPHGCDIVNFGAVFRSMTGFGGTGEGPNGPAMAFRLQSVAPLPTEAGGVADSSGLTHRESYTRPCQYLAKPYPVVNPRDLSRRAGR